MLGRRFRGTETEDRVLRALGWTMLITTVAWTVWSMLPGHWDINQSLPFHYSDALHVITAFALITRAGWAIAICYYWGLMLNLQSIITPDLNYFDYPILEFAMYWFLHIVAFVMPVQFIWGPGYRPTWRGYGVAYLATIIWAGLALIANAITSANYGYLSRGPKGVSILDLLGPWPVYIFWEAVIIAVVWSVMTRPWRLNAGRRHTTVDRLGAIRRKATGGSTRSPAQQMV